MLNEKFSTTGFGRRTVFPLVTCLNSDNLTAGATSPEFWTETVENGEMVSVLSDGTLCFSPFEKKTLIKRLTVKPETVYFLSFTGHTLPPEWTDFHFGITDSDGFPFKNYHTKHEKSFFVTDQGFDQMLTVRGQDGEWWPRTYIFYTGSNTEIGFFADGTSGKVILKDLKIFEAVKALNTETRTASGVMNYKEDACDCAPENNYLANLEFFEGFDYFNTFIFKENNTLKYSSADMGCCYFAWLPIEENRIYTFSFKEKVIKSGGAVYGFIAENADGKRRWLTCKSADTQGREVTEAHAFVSARGEKIAFAVFDGGGEVVFEDFRIFLFGNGLQK